MMNNQDEHDGGPASASARQTPESQMDAQAEAGVAGLEAEAGREAAEGEDALRDEVAKWKDLALRAQADLDNFRKRMAREAGELRKFAAADVLEELLPILDNFDFGLQAARAESENSAITLGMSMVRRQLDDFLAGRGVVEVPAEGQTFDPHVHDAMASEASDSVGEGMVLRAVRRGFRLHERVLRPAMVVVSTGPAAGPVETAQETAGDHEG